MKATDFLAILRNVALIYPGLDFSSEVIILWGGPALENPIKSLALDQTITSNLWPDTPALVIGCSHWMPGDLGHRTIRDLGRAIKSLSPDPHLDIRFLYGTEFGRITSIEAQSDCLVVSIWNAGEAAR
jgi:hypothetical protein